MNSTHDSLHKLSDVFDHPRVVAFLDILRNPFDDAINALRWCRNLALALLKWSPDERCDALMWIRFEPGVEVKREYVLKELSKLRMW